MHALTRVPLSGEQPRPARRGRQPEHDIDDHHASVDAILTRDTEAADTLARNPLPERADTVHSKE